MIMRKYVCLLLILAMMLPLASCEAGGDAGAVSDTSLAAADIGNGKVSNYLELSVPEFHYIETTGVTLKNNTENDGHYIINIFYPQTDNEAIDKNIETMLKALADEFKTGNTGGTLDVQYTPYTHNEEIIGFVFDVYAQGNETGDSTYRKTAVYSLSDGQRLHISDLLDSESDYLRALSRIASSYLTQNYAEQLSGNASLIMGTVMMTQLNKENFEEFVVDDDNLYILLDGVTGLGQITMPISLIELADMLTGRVTIAVTPDTTEDALDGERKYIALTFDDGPNPLTTPLLLDVLAEYGAKATFFTLGQRAENNTAIISRMAEEGHAVASHTYDHQQLTKLHADSVRSEIEGTNEILTGITGLPVTMIRPPYGSKDDTVKQICEENGMSIILWNIDPEDWKDKDAELVASRIIEKVQAGDIILLHDIYSTSVDAAEIVVRELTAQGYQFVTVDEMINYYTENGMEVGVSYRSAH